MSFMTAFNASTSLLRNASQHASLSGALVSVDEKVLFIALTYRLQHVTYDLVHPDQKGFVKGRFIHHHVRFLDNLQDIIICRD